MVTTRSKSRAAKKMRAKSKPKEKCGHRKKCGGRTPVSVKSHCRMKRASAYVRR